MIKYYQSAILLNGYPVENCTFGYSNDIYVCLLCLCVFAFACVEYPNKIQSPP